MPTEDCLVWHLAISQDITGGKGCSFTMEGSYTPPNSAYTDCEVVQFCSASFIHQRLHFHINGGITSMFEESKTLYKWIILINHIPGFIVKNNTIQVTDKYKATVSVQYDPVNVVGLYLGYRLCKITCHPHSVGFRYGSQGCKNRPILCRSPLETKCA